MMRIVFKNAKLFNIGEVKKGFFLKKCLYSRGSESMLKKRLLFLEMFYEKCGENMSNRIINVGGIDFLRKGSFRLGREVKGIEKEGSSKVSTKDCVAMS